MYFIFWQCLNKWMKKIRKIKYFKKLLNGFIFSEKLAIQLYININFIAVGGLERGKQLFIMEITGLGNFSPVSFFPGKYFPRGIFSRDIFPQYFNFLAIFSPYFLIRFNSCSDEERNLLLQVSTYFRTI